LCGVVETEYAALVVLRAAVGARRGVMRRRDERVMAGGIEGKAATDGNGVALLR
jgi:hypothetical protein